MPIAERWQQSVCQPVGLAYYVCATLTAHRIQLVRVLDAVQLVTLLMPCCEPTSKRAFFAVADILADTAYHGSLFAGEFTLCDCRVEEKVVEISNTVDARLLGIFSVVSAWVNLRLNQTVACYGLHVMKERSDLNHQHIDLFGRC